MTTLIAWMSRSGSAERTLYLGADSLGTGRENPAINKTFVRKVYASSGTPEIFSLSGDDVGAGQNFLRRLVKDINDNSSDENRSQVGVIDRVTDFTKHPAASVGRSANLDILHVVRDGIGDAASFTIFRLLSPNKSNAEWRIERIPECRFPKGNSVLICCLGSGKQAYTKRLDTLVLQDQGYVARQYFWALCDIVGGKPNPKIMTGGVPQLAKLGQAGNGLLAGVHYDGKPYVAGSLVSNPQDHTEFWVNETFTACDPTTGCPLSRAQVYGRRKEEDETLSR